MPCSQHTSSIPHTSIAVNLAHHTLSVDTYATQTTVHASESQEPSHPHRVPQQPLRQTKDDHMTTDTTQGHRPISKSGRNLITMQVNINGIRNKLEKLKLFIHNTHAYIITIQETKLTPKANTPNVHNFTTVCTDMLLKAGGGLITLFRDNITFTTTDIPSTINTHNTELQMVKVHINNTKHITIANLTRMPNTTLQQTSSPAITTVSNTLYNRTPKHIVNCFTKQFTNTVKHATHKINRYTNSATHKIQGYNITLTATQVQEAIKHSKNNNSQCPDKLNIRHLKHIGPLGLAFLTSMLKTALNTYTIPHIWKLANIVPIPKPNKDIDKGTSYRPISILSVIAKTLEKSLLSYITANIQKHPRNTGTKHNSL